MQKAKKRAILLLGLVAAVSLLAGLFLGAAGAAAAGTTTDLVTSTVDGDWSEVKPGQGTWTADHAAGTVTADTFGSDFGLEGAAYVTSAANPYGSFEMSARLTVTDFDKDKEIGYIGLLPWYFDKDNYLSVQLKFSTLDTSGQFIISETERAQGCAIEQILVTGKYGGQDKFVSATTQEANTVYAVQTNTALKNAKKDVLNAGGHLLTVRFENNTAAGLSYKITVLYEDVEIGSTDAYYYSAKAQPGALGLMAQNVKGTFSAVTADDFVATHGTAKLARDWLHKDGYTYRTLNGVDCWSFDDAGTLTMDTREVLGTNGRSKSVYTVTGSNYASYNTNRGFTANPLAETAEGLPQNYRVSATLTAKEFTARTDTKELRMGYGIIPWYLDDMNYVDVTLRRMYDRGSDTPRDELVLFGWVDGSSLPVGTNVYALPAGFDMTKPHKLTVEKKSVEFLVYLDDETEPVLVKRIQGTGTNGCYGYTGYNMSFTATPLTGDAIYAAYDEISILDNEGSVWKSSGKTRAAWTFGDGGLTLAAAETDENQKAVSYLIGVSDVYAANMAVEADVRVTRGSTSQLTEVMLSPWMPDDDNYLRMGLVWKDGKAYARVAFQSVTPNDVTGEDDLVRVYEQTEIAAVDLSRPLKLAVRKVGETVVLEVDGEVVYGKKLAGIGTKTGEYGVYCYNADLAFSRFETVGYKKFERIEAGDWITSGISKTAWTLDGEGNMIGDCLYAEDDTAVDLEDEFNVWALRQNPASLTEDYTLSVTVRRLDYSRAQDRIGVVCWYVDQDNFLVYMLDHWRSDSPNPRTTFWGKIGGDHLSTRYNHGAWLPDEASDLEKDHIITVVKTGNSFVMTVDDGLGMNRMTVALPTLASGTPVYTGFYVLNDKVLFSEYGVYQNGGERQVARPGTPEQATDTDSEKEFTIEEYVSETYVDEFTGLTSEGGGQGGEVVDPTPPPTTDPTPEKPGKPDRSWVVWVSVVCAVVGAGGIGAAVYFILRSRKKKA